MKKILFALTFSLLTLSSAMAEERQVRAERPAIHRFSANMTVRCHYPSQKFEVGQNLTRSTVLAKLKDERYWEQVGFYVDLGNHTIITKRVSRLVKGTRCPQLTMKLIQH